MLASSLAFLEESPRVLKKYVESRKNPYKTYTIESLNFRLSIFLERLISNQF